MQTFVTRSPISLEFCGEWQHDPNSFFLFSFCVLFGFLIENLILGCIFCLWLIEDKIHIFYHKTAGFFSNFIVSIPYFSCHVSRGDQFKVRQSISRKQDENYFALMLQKQLFCLNLHGIQGFFPQVHSCFFLSR